MQQRPLRLGDILDDYCPRERRVTNHAVVAMIDDEVKQTRCTTCDADHAYKEAKVPAPRRKRSDGTQSETPEGTLRPRQMPDDIHGEEPSETDSSSATLDAEAESDPAAPSTIDDDGPVHRPLIRATLPRPEGQVPERKSPEFTIRQSGARGREADGNRAGQRHGQGRRPMRGPGSGSTPSRYGSPQPGSGAPRSGNPGHRPPGSRPAQPGNPRGNRPGQGGGRGAGRKRGR